MSHLCADVRGHDGLIPCPLLTKSLFVSGHQCLKQLWRRVHEPNAVELQPDKVLQDLFDQGRQVGELARTRWPNGTLIARDERAARLEATRSAIAAGATVLFEPAFEADSISISADVLETTSGGWKLVEVKHASSCKEKHIPGVQQAAAAEVAFLSCETPTQ